MERKEVEKLYNLAKEKAKFVGVDENIVFSFITIESNWITSAIRFEPHYQWLYKPEDFYKGLKISLETEKALQKFSYGPMQIMGAVARELGYKGHLHLLPLQVEQSLYFSCLHFKKLHKKYEALDDAVASYNAGSAKKNDLGLYTNQSYVNKFMEVYKDKSFF